MEELRSTEILDREIQEDARRKAEKLLKANEAECRQILDDVAFRIERVRTEKEAEYAKRLDSFRRDTEAAIPLEKERRHVSFMDGAVHKALDEWFESIGPKKRLALYSNMLEKARSLFGDSKVSVVFAGYDETEIRSTVESLFGKAGIASVVKLDRKGAASYGFSDGLIVESASSGIKCRATLEEKRADLLSDKRQEMAEALMGGRLPE